MNHITTIRVISLESGRTCEVSLSRAFTSDKYNVRFALKNQNGSIEQIEVVETDEDAAYEEELRVFLREENEIIFNESNVSITEEVISQVQFKRTHSRVISHIGYIEQTQTLIAVFIKRRSENDIYVYYNVPKKVVHSLPLGINFMASFTKEIKQKGYRYDKEDNPKIKDIILKHLT